MKYISGIYALNLKCKLNTCGDWHQSSLNWDDVVFDDSDKSIYKEYGIEEDSYQPYLGKKYNVANTIRACLDLLEKGHYDLAQGMKDDFICNNNYMLEIFNQVYKMKNKNNWKEIDQFMKKEYKMDWEKYKEKLK